MVQNNANCMSKQLKAVCWGQIFIRNALKYNMDISARCTGVPEQLRFES